MEFLLFLAFGFVLMWFLLVMPQRRRTQAQASMIDSLKPGDYVVTAGGLYGTVTDVGEDDLGLEIAPDVEVRVAKKAIGALVPEDEIEDVEVDDETDVEPEAAPEDAPDSASGEAEAQPTIPEDRR